MKDIEFRQYFETITEDSVKRASDCQRQTREILHRIRERTASHDETAAVVKAVKYMKAQKLKPENERQLFVLTAYYLSPEQPTLEDIAEMSNCYITTVRRDMERIVKWLSIILFGADAIAWK